MSEDITTTIDVTAFNPTTGSPNGQIHRRTASKVCIVGFADGHRDHAPWETDDMEFWGINRLHAVLPNKPWTRWFEIHDLERFYSTDEEHKQFLRDADFPVYVRPQDMQIATEWGIDATPFPQADMLNLFEPYFTNTISWLLAFAIALEYEEIHLYGVDMAQDTITQAEYRQQRPSCEWLIGLAQGRGIRVVMPPGSDLMKSSHLYGFDDDVYRQKLEARLQELGQRKEQIRAEMVQHSDRASWLQSRISELDGAMQEVTYNLTNLVTQHPIPDIQEIPNGP